MARDIRNFRPAQFAQLDTAMWQAYYRHDFIKLFILLIRLSWVYGHPNPILTVKIAYYSAQAAIIFRKTRGHEDTEAILRHLSKFFALLSGHNVCTFDYDKAAELELAWWLVDRNPENYQESRASALAQAMAVVYGVEADTLKVYGQKREEAMLQIGELHHDRNFKVDWRRIERLLNEAYADLKRSVDKGS